MRAIHGLGLLPLVALVAACGSSGASGASPTGDDAGTTSDSTTPTTGGLPCDVADVMAKSCQSCHGTTPSFGAPMPLVTHGDFMAAAPSDASKKVWEVVKDRVHRGVDEVGRMPQKPNAPLSSTDLATLDAWFGAGAPQGTGETCGAPPIGGGTDPTPKPLSCTPDAQVRPKSKWTMPKDQQDVYVCYGWEYDVAAKRHVIGVAPTIQNSKIVHHILLMQSDSPVDPTPHACGEGSIGMYRMLYAWAPGVGSFELPKEAGLPAEPGKAHYVVQIHYNNIKALEGETDESGFDFCSTDALRPNDADVLAFGSMKFSIPAKGSLDVTASFGWSPASFPLPEIKAIGAFPHMHQLGKSISTTLRRADGTTADLGTDAAFDFSNQFFAELPSIAIKPGDTIDTRCVWQNPGDSPVGFGEDTADEMCYSFTMYYPKITRSPWSWAAPAYLAKTAPTK